MEGRNELISIHAPLTGSDVLDKYTEFVVFNFNPRSPYGERLPQPGFQNVLLKFQSTLPLRGATYVHQCGRKNHHISIHAPLTGSDKRSKTATPANFIFQSTLPLRGATAVAPFASIKGRISIHAPLTGSDTVADIILATAPISIHAPLTGSDFGFTLSILAFSQFQSTLPLRGATATLHSPAFGRGISIHAPLTGSDL